MANEPCGQEYLLFTLANDQYCISVQSVREVVDYGRITRIPNADDFVKGLINLRGTGVPVIDLRVKFGLSNNDQLESSSIVVVELNGRGGDLILVGVIADSVDGVIDLPPESIQQTPQYGTRIDNSCVAGIGKRENRFLIVLDIERVFHDHETAGYVELADDEVGGPAIEGDSNDTTPR